MKKTKTGFDGLYVLQGENFRDKRGFLREIFKKELVKENMVFSVVSSSKRNVIRGLHFQEKNSQAKFVTVIKGEILDVAVDLRKKSKTFGKHYKIILSENNSKFLFIPKGFAHGFLAKKKENIVLYSCSNYRDPKEERSIAWNDSRLSINWGIKKPIVSKKDAKAFSFNEFIKE
tara:strand:+ start:1449 stop:1970 length:522 start_codon:yes stop_codon:yes gene_type:complete